MNMTEATRVATVLESATWTYEPDPQDDDEEQLLPLLNVRLDCATNQFGERTIAVRARASKEYLSRHLDVGDHNAPLTTVIAAAEHAGCYIDIENDWLALR